MPIKPNRISSLLIVATLTLGAATLAGCQKPEDSAGKGPAEVAGKELDEAAVVAGKELKQAAEKTGELIQKAGEKIQERAKEAQK